MENESTATFMTNEKNNIDRIETPDGIVYRIESTLSVEASDKANVAAEKAETAATKAESAATSATEKASAANEAAAAANEAARKAKAASSGIASELAKKQDKLTAGEGISITGSTISAAAKKAEVIPLASSVLNPESGEHAVFIVKAGHVCTLVVNGRTNNNLYMLSSLIDDEASTTLNGLLPDGYRHDGTLNIQVASNVDRVIITLMHDQNNKPLYMQDIRSDYTRYIPAHEFIAYTFTWAI